MIDVEEFRIPDCLSTAKSQAPPGQVRKGRGCKTTEPFIRGPLPLNWFARASKLPRKNAILVGLVLYYLAGLRRDNVGLVLAAKRCEVFGLGRKAVQRGLKDLERADLVRVTRQPGKAPRVDVKVGMEIALDV